MPSEQRPRRSRVASLRAEAMVGSTDSQSCGANLSSASITFVADSTDRMTAPTVPFTHGEWATVKLCRMRCVVARCSRTSFLKCEPWSDTKMSARHLPPGGSNTRVHRVGTSAACSSFAEAVSSSQIYLRRSSFDHESTLVVLVAFA